MDWLGGDNLKGRDLEETTEGQRMFELEELICRTPATTVAGVSIQAKVTGGGGGGGGGYSSRQ